MYWTTRNNAAHALRAPQWLLDNLAFVITVIFPVSASAIYFGVVASDVYISESRFVVRSPDRQVASPLGLLLKGSGFSRAQDDSYTVRDFMLSRDAMGVLDHALGLRLAYGRGDLVRRFPGLDWDDSKENMHRYYQDMVQVELDPQSSIAILTTRAFTANEATRINRKLLEMSEELVNQLNERGRNDLVQFAQHEVDIAEGRARQAAIALARFRNDKGVIDPERQSTISFQQIARLQEELIAAKSQLGQLQLLARDNPQIPALGRRIQILESEIARESEHVAGNGRSLASKASEFQRLALEKEFAEKQLASALTSLEQARNEARRKQLYLERIAQPNAPDAAMEPRRLRAVLGTAVLSLVAWGVVSMVMASIREHVN